MKSKAGHNSIGSEVRKHADVADGAGGRVEGEERAPHLSILPWARVPSEQWGCAYTSALMREDEKGTEEREIIATY